MSEADPKIPAQTEMGLWMETEVVGPIYCSLVEVGMIPLQPLDHRLFSKQCSEVELGAVEQVAFI
jgi:hypothetical protein